MDDKPEPRRHVSPISFAGGMGVGGILFLILTMATGNPALGLLYGLLPGVAVGLWLGLTSRP